MVFFLYYWLHFVVIIMFTMFIKPTHIYCSDHFNSTNIDGFLTFILVFVFNEERKIEAGKPNASIKYNSI